MEDLVKTFYNNGKVYRETPYANGKKQGVEKLYRLNGMLKAEVNFLNGEKHGLSTWYFDCGHVCVQSNYVNGDKNGQYTLYKSSQEESGTCKHSVKTQYFASNCLDLGKKMIWFTSDNHFFHKNIIKYANRPEDCDSRMFSGLKKVGANDTLIHLGDLVLSNNQDQIDKVISNMPGKIKWLIAGNHDHKRTLKFSFWDKVIKYKQTYVITIDGIKVALSHRSYELMEISADIKIFGHIHEKGQKFQWVDNCLLINACVEHWDYSPFSWDTIVQEFRSK